MDNAKHKAALDALNDLILSELQGEGRQRFASVKRLAMIAQKLLLENDLRPEDARRPRFPGDIDGDFDGPDFVGGGGQLQVAGGFGGDQNQMVREMFAAFNPMLKAQQEQNVAKERETLARELNQLLVARDKLKPSERFPVTERINEILTEMKGKEDGLSLVPAFDVRRHQTGTNLERNDQGRFKRTFPDGERRDADAPQASGAERTDPEGLDFGDAERRSRLDGEAGDFILRPHLDNPGVLAEESEAAPEAGVGGAVHERPSRTGDGGDASDDRCTNIDRDIPF